MDEKKKKNPYAVNGAAAYKNVSGSSPVGEQPTYAGTYDKQLADMYDKISTRPAFQYDATKDPLFQQYKGQYIQQGKLAMKDTMGQAAALTGGYGTSYGQQVGQQSYNAYLQKLGDVVPELYSQAYNQYQNEGDRMLQQYSMLQQQRDSEYNRYQDDLNRWWQQREYDDKRGDVEYQRQRDEQEYADKRGDIEYERQRAEQQYQDEKDRYDKEYADKRGDIEYDRQRHELEYQEDKDRYEREYGDKRGDVEYERQQQQRSRILDMIQYGYKPTDEDLEKAGMTREEADQLIQLWAAGDPEMALRIGIIDADQYFQWTGKYPEGYGQQGQGETPYYQTLDQGGGGTPTYGQGAPESQVKPMLQAIEQARSPQEAQRLFDQITDKTFSMMSEDQIARLHEALQKAGA